jgi:hypothetical protein
MLCFILFMMCAYSYGIQLNMPRYRTPLAACAVIALLHSPQVALVAGVPRTLTLKACLQHCLISHLHCLAL